MYVFLSIKKITTRGEKFKEKNNRCNISLTIYLHNPLKPKIMQENSEEYRHEEAMSDVSFPPFLHPCRGGPPATLFRASTLMFFICYYHEVDRSSGFITRVLRLAVTVGRVACGGALSL